jgi:hypothetical protein
MTCTHLYLLLDHFFTLIVHLLNKIEFSIEKQNKTELYKAGNTYFLLCHLIQIHI